MVEPPELTPLRFIPYRRADIATMLDAKGTLPPDDEAQYQQARRRIEEYFQKDFYHIKQQLKDAYAPVDPDADTRKLEQINDTTPNLSGMLQQVLERGNYEKVSKQDVEKALASASLFQLRLYVDLDDFEEVLLYTRGASRREETLSELFGLWKRRVQFVNYERVVLYIRLKKHIDNDSALGDCPPGSTMLKLFQNVPAADLEMLFPNIRVGMRVIDKLMIGVPAVISGGVVVTTKMGTTLLLLGSLLGFWLGLSTEPVEINRAAMIAAAASLVALGGYCWKQFSNFRNRRLKYTQALTQNLYFKLLDNNAGVFYRVLDDAEESEIKESLLAYYFLLDAQQAVTAQQLDEAIEDWFSQSWNYELDFEIEDALQKLETLELARCDAGLWTALAPTAKASSTVSEA